MKQIVMTNAETKINAFQDEELFEHIASDLADKGYSICQHALPETLAKDLYRYQQNLGKANYSVAGIGRKDEFSKNDAVRTDEIVWITDQSEAGKAWLDWSSAMQGYLNRRLFLGLFSFESHFAHYGPGDFYKRHLDAFRGETNRVLSMVAYLNPDWSEDNGGELVLYENEEDQTGVHVKPEMGTMVIFLSEEFPHEVLPASKDRYSIAGWFRVNTSNKNKIDPPS